MQDNETPFSVIYISGSGRSGSTMLERIFHSAPGVFALGEFHCLWRLPPHDIACACGSPFAADPFWSEVRAVTGLTDERMDELRQLEQAVCRSGLIARHGFSLAALGRDPRVRRFVALQRALFTAIAQVSGASVLVDSSKAGPRAWLLALDPAVRFVHLHRDPADVLVSWRSVKFDPGLGTPMKRMPISAAALDWGKVDRLIARLAQTLVRQTSLAGESRDTAEALRRVIRVDYARLCAAPRDTVAALWADLGLDDRATGTPAWLGPDTIRPAADYHSLNGNPDRFDPGPFRISARRAEWGRVSARDRTLIRATAAALRLIAPEWGHAGR